MLEQANQVWGWLSAFWFAPSTLRQFQYESPLFLYLIAALPLLWLLRWAVFHRFRDRLDVAFFSGRPPGRQQAWLRHFPALLFLLFLSLALLALARPQRTDERVEQFAEGIDIVLVMDISESMKIEDFTPNRLEASKAMAKEFVKGRVQDRIGLVIFAGEAFSLAPPTTDYSLLDSYLDEVQFRMIRKGGTAIGSALAVATNRLTESEAKSKVVILLSDGDNNAGNIDPLTAARLAHAYDIRIYSIIVGRDGRVPFGKDPFGRTQYIEESINEGTLRDIAQIGEGRFFRALDNQALAEVFGEIDRLEKVEIKETRYVDTVDYYHVYLTWSVVCFLAWLSTKNTFLTNPLED